MDMHLKQQIQTRGPNCPFNCSDILPWSIREARDDSIGFKDLHNIQAKVAKETYKFHINDQQSVQIWINTHPQFVLLHQQYVIDPPS
jgi:hypothetical protein